MTTKSATLRMPRRGTYSSSTKRRRTARGTSVSVGPTSLKAAAAVALLAALFAASIFTSWKIRQVAGELDTLRAQYQEQVEQQKSLAGELEKLLDRQSLERLGKSLGLHPAAKEQIRIVRK